MHLGIRQSTLVQHQSNRDIVLNELSTFNHQFRSQRGLPLSGFIDRFSLRPPVTKVRLGVMVVNGALSLCPCVPRISKTRPILFSAFTNPFLFLFFMLLLNIIPIQLSDKAGFFYFPFFEDFGKGKNNRKGSTEYMRVKTQCGDTIQD